MRKYLYWASLIYLKGRLYLYCNLNYVEEIEIASKSKIISKNNKIKKTYFDYDTALKKRVLIDLYFTSNSQHYKYCKSIPNKSVIVDKPAVLSSAELNS